MPYPIYGAYVLLTGQTPAADPAFVRIPIDHEDSWQNGGYAVQWWLFAVMALLAFGWQARKEARGDEPAPRRDRVDEADRAGAGARAPAVDRVEEAIAARRPPPARNRGQRTEARRQAPPTA